MSRKWGAARFAETGPYTSVMIGLWLERDAADLLALDGYQPADSLHITLHYLGEAALYDEIDLAHLLVAVESAAWEPLAGEVSGIGRFYASDDSDGQDVIYASPYVTGLAELRQRLLDYLPPKFRDQANRPWVPHITLAYVEAGAEWPTLALPTAPLRFDALTVAVAGKATVIPFRREPYYYRDLTRLARADGSARLFTEVPELATLPAEVPVLPVPGTYQHPVYGEIAMTAERIGRFVANHNGRVYQQHIPIDAEHETHLSGALGYLGDMTVKEDGSAWASVEWTDRGRTLVASGRFRYVSPTLYPAWEDPGTNEVFEDVVAGLAVTTRPFFKDAYLAPLVASETGLRALDPGDPAHQRYIELPREERREEPMSDKSKPAGEPQDTPQPPAQGQAFTELQQRYGELERKWEASEQRATAAEQRMTAAEGELARIREAQQEQAYRDEVLGKVEGGVRWFGDVDQHVELLKALPDDKRQVYIESQRAQARSMEQAINAPAVGSGARASGAASAVETELEGRIATYRQTHPGTTKEQAYTEVLQSDPELRRRYQEAQQA